MKVSRTRRKPVIVFFFFKERRYISPLRLKFFFFRCLPMGEVHLRRTSRSFCSWNQEFSVRTPHAKASHIAANSQCEVKNYTYRRNPDGST